MMVDKHVTSNEVAEAVANNTVEPLQGMVDELAGYGLFRPAIIAGLRMAIDRIEQNIASVN